LTSFVAVALIAVGHSAIAADSFRIETKIFVGEEEEKQEPVSISTTLFHDGIVYDFLEKPQQTAVFRKPTGDKPARFILLNDQRQIQPEVSTEKLIAAMKDLRSWAVKQRDPFLQFAAEPTFDETFDRATGKLELVSYLQTYTVETTQTQRQDALGPYREYLDWYTQLNTLLTAPIPPDVPEIQSAERTANDMRTSSSCPFRELPFESVPSRPYWGMAASRQAVATPASFATSAPLT
jgi:hypothetical protein